MGCGRRWPAKPIDGFPPAFTGVNYGQTFGDPMPRFVAFAVCLFASTCLLPDIAESEEPPIALKAMGSFHVGGRLIEVSGQPVKELTLTPGGVPPRIDPNGK
jgi:hypothetical protein